MINSTKICKACLYVDEMGGTLSENMINECDAYAHMEPLLLQMLARFDFERDVLPFQLRYRAFNVYVCDIGGWINKTYKKRFMLSLGHIARGRPSRVYLFWTGETWEEFCSFNPDLADYNGCINACELNWPLQAAKHLEKQNSI